MYERFLERNSTFEDRIDAFTSGIITPDTKGLTLWAMGRNKAYNAKSLYDVVDRFAGGSPLRKGSIWVYCNGNPSLKQEGSLYSIGAVVKEELQDTGYCSVIAYRKTDIGVDFGEPLAALACMLVNKLDVFSPRPRYVSMLRLLGQASKSKERDHRRGFAVYKIIKLLAENPDHDFTVSEVAVRTGLHKRTAQATLKSLESADVIYYYAPHVEVDGRKSKPKRVKDSIRSADYDHVYESAKASRRSFSQQSDLKAVFEYCKSRVGQEVTNRSVAENCGMLPNIASHHLSILAELGYLEGELYDSDHPTSVKCTEITSIVWKDLMRHVEKTAEDMCLHDDLNVAMRMYDSDENLRLQHTRRWMNIYDIERTRRGPVLAAHRRHKVLEVIRGGVRKPSVMRQVLRKEHGIEVGKGLQRVLNNLVKSGAIVRKGIGDYEPKN